MHYISEKRLEVPEEKFFTFNFKVSDLLVEGLYMLTMVVCVVGHSFVACRQLIVLVYQFTPKTV